MSDTFRAGWTERIIYALTHDGEILDLTGLTPTLVGSKASGAALGFSGSVGIVSAVAGTVYFDPGPNDLSAADSPYYVRWAITDVSSKTAYFPRSAPITWIIQNP